MEGQAPQNNNGTIAVVVDDDRISPTQPLPPPPGRPRHDNMYIVQFPKDQVYRVPPRENALIVERYRNPPPKVKNKKKGRGCFCCCFCPRVLLTIALIFVAIIAIVGITLATLFFIFNPSGPTFSITNFTVKNPPGPKNTLPKYQISLRAKNPNDRLGIVYENSEVTMLFEAAKVATGKFPRLEQNRNATTLFDVDLIGTNGALPKKMANSMVDEKSKTALAFGLDMRLRVRIVAGGLNSWVMNSNVVCKFQVSSLGNNTRVLSQQCDTNFKQY